MGLLNRHSMVVQRSQLGCESLWQSVMDSPQVKFLQGILKVTSEEWAVQPKLEMPGSTVWTPLITGIILISPALPEVSTRATLSCYSAQTGRYWYHQGVLMTTCNSQSCLPKEKTQHGYTFTADNDKAEVTILSLDRTRDGGSWVCATGFNQSISLDVYSFPSGISFTQGGATDVDLGESQTILQCQTDGCTYPAPNIWWYFKDIAPSAPRTFYKDTGTQVTGGSCTSPEELYTSSLVLPLYTIWQENIDKNVTLSCGIEYSNVSRNVYSQESKQIRYAGFPTVIGCIDGTFIRIIAPTANEPNFVNRKGFHSLNVQMVCDAQFKITNCVAKWPGSTHDSRVFRDSVLCHNFENGKYDRLLLGDSGYPCKSFLMTPFLSPNNHAEIKCNNAFCRTRVKIEQTFGILKRIFNCLHDGLRVAPNNAAVITMACAVLHNICIEMGDIIPAELDDAFNETAEYSYLEKGDGEAVRQLICNNHFY